MPRFDDHWLRIEVERRVAGATAHGRRAQSDLSGVGQHEAHTQHRGLARRRGGLAGAVDEPGKAANIQDTVVVARSERHRRTDEFLLVESFAHDDAKFARRVDGGVQVQAREDAQAQCSRQHDTDFDRSGTAPAQGSVAEFEVFAAERMARDEVFRAGKTPLVRRAAGAGQCERSCGLIAQVSIERAMRKQVESKDGDDDQSNECERSQAGSPCRHAHVSVSPRAELRSWPRK